jgi:predicted DNA-binding transcriptional regulator AlpA
MSPVEPSRLVNSRQAAELLNISQRSLHRLDTEGRLPPAIRFGEGKTLRRWRRSDILAWIDNGGCPAA